MHLRTCFQATETLFRMAVTRGIINPLKHGEVRYGVVRYSFITVDGQNWLLNQFIRKD